MEENKFITKKVGEERELQNSVLDQLRVNDWEYVDIHSYDAMLANFKCIVEQRNMDRLKLKDKTRLSSGEFERLINIITSRSSFSEYAKFFLDDDFELTLDNNEKIYINIYNKKKWCQNVFQVTEELSHNGIRHDIILLINGLPLCNIELKKPSVRIQNAYDQTKSYSGKLQGLMKFIQIFVISNKNNTRYYANNSQINEKFVFSWVDHENNPVENIFKFVDHFMHTCSFSEYISRYMINKEKDNMLIAMRGYQVHGAKSIINHLQSTQKNGYIWHATGSGKTITSFKVAQVIANELDQFDKVVFLVDRRDLDSQTVAEYNSFLPSHGQIEQVNRAEVLYKQIKSSSNKLLITTIQKMDRLLRSDVEEITEGMKDLKDENIVFIIDECHRSQFGEMHQRIKEHFNNARYIGFTGTPVFKDENKDDDKQQITNDVFDVNVHQYLIQNAISDKNVLPFQIDYYDLHHFKLKDRVKDIVENEEIRNLLESEGYIKSIVKDILEVHDEKTNKRQFFGLLAVTSIDSLIKFYDEFERQQLEFQSKDDKYKPLKISATFSMSNAHNDEMQLRCEAMSKIISDFNAHTNSNESIDDVSSFSSRLQKVIKDDVKTNDVGLDLVIVVEQLLTGFDAKKLNTLYVARAMKGHGLIQAFSRTNRVYTTNKENGIIVSYVPGLKEEVDLAIQTFSNSDNVNAFCSRDYNSLKSDLKEKYDLLESFDVEDILENPTRNEESTKQFVKGAKEISDLYRQIRTMREYDSSEISDKFGIDYVNEIISESQRIKSKLNSLTKSSEGEEVVNDLKEVATNILDDLELPIKIENIDTIDDEYILSKLSLIKSLQEQKNYAQVQIESEKTLEKMKIEGYELSDEWEEIHNELKQNPKIDFNEKLRLRQQKTIADFIERYQVDNFDITTELDFKEFKTRYNEDNITKWARNTGVGLKQRRLEKTLITQTLDKLKVFRNIFK